jgi:hypothetical protein
MGSMLPYIAYMDPMGYITHDFLRRCRGRATAPTGEPWSRSFDFTPPDPKQLGRAVQKNPWYPSIAITTLW